MTPPHRHTAHGHAAQAHPFPHGSPSWSNKELRDNLEHAHNSARDKWAAYLSDLALGYADAYKMVSGALKGIEAVEKARAEQSAALWSVILSGVAGGFLGGVVSLRLKPVLQQSGFAFVRSAVTLDTAKTVTSDVAKFETKQIVAVYKEAVDTNPLKLPAADPAQYWQILNNELLHNLVKIDDAFIETQRSAPQVYRNQMFILYNSPFIWNAPKDEDLEKWRGKLARPLEVFLWADWANHLDTQHWLKRIMVLTDGDKEARGMGFDRTGMYLRDVNDLAPVLDRLVACNVPLQYISQHTPGHYVRGMYRPEHLFLNPLWIRLLASRYQDTFLGELLTRIGPGIGAAQKVGANLSLRPGSYNLM
jgi:hypothetical protein